MNSTELLDQFVVEARECLEQIGQRLLEVERSPTDTALLNDLFRLVHTLKGNCGLFEFKALERVVHAGEDLLDRVRSQTLPYSNDMADVLLDAMDFTAELVDQIDASGHIDPAADGRSQALAQALREHLEPMHGVGVTPSAPQAAAAQATAPVIAPVIAAPAWLARLPAALLAQRPDAVAVRYTPEPECFFKGEDPWRMAQLTPGLLDLVVQPLEAWPAGSDLDCYRCNLDLVMLSSAPKAYVEEHFRYVPEQVELWDLGEAAERAAPAASAPATSAGPELAVPQPPAPARASMVDLIRQRAQALWNDQHAMLQRPQLPAGALAAVRVALQSLLQVCTQPASLQVLDALPADASVALLLNFMQQHGPQGALEAQTPEQTAQAHPAGDTAKRGDDNSPERHGKVLKVTQEKIDRLMDLIGEMVVAKNALPYLATRAEGAGKGRGPAGLHQRHGGLCAAGPGLASALPVHALVVASTHHQEASHPCPTRIPPPCPAACRASSRWRWLCRSPSALARPPRCRPRPWCTARKARPRTSPRRSTPPAPASTRHGRCTTS